MSRWRAIMQGFPESMEVQDTKEKLLCRIGEIYLPTISLASSASSLSSSFFFSASAAFCCCKTSNISWLAAICLRVSISSRRACRGKYASFIMTFFYLYAGSDK